MKKTFKFMAMALAAVVMAGAAVSCEPIDNNEDQTEQDGDQTGNEDGGDVAAYPTLEGKQWVYNDPAMGGMGYAYDFTVAGKMSEGYCMGTTGYSPVEVVCVFTPVNATSGTFTLSGEPYYAEPMEVAYRNLTDTTVEVDAQWYDPMAEAGTFVELTVPTEPVVWE